MKPVLFLLLMFGPWLRAAELAFGFYSAPATFFTREEAQKMPENGQADIGAILKSRGYDMPDGSTACYDAGSAQLFLRSTQRDLNRLRSQAKDAAVENQDAGTVKQVKVTAVCHAIPVSAVPADFAPGSSLTSLPQDKLKVIDRASLLCRGGQRSKLESRVEKVEPNKPKPADDGDAEPAPPEAEREFEIEVTVGEDGTTIDLNMAWSLLTPALAPPDKTGEFKLSTQVLSTHKGSVMQELGVTTEAEPRLVFLTLQFYIMPVPAAEK